METRIEHGDPRDVICAVAEKLHVDVVVMGSHGHGLIKRAFLGSVSNHCVQNVKCPVLIVKKPKPDCRSKRYSIYHLSASIHGFYFIPSIFLSTFLSSSLLLLYLDGPG